MVVKKRQIPLRRRHVCNNNKKITEPNSTISSQELQLLWICRQTRSVTRKKDHPFQQHRWQWRRAALKSRSLLLQERVRCDFWPSTFCWEWKRPRRMSIYLQSLSCKIATAGNREGWITWNPVQEISSAWPGLHRPWAAQAWAPGSRESMFTCWAVSRCLLLFFPGASLYSFCVLIIQIATCCPSIPFRPHPS